MHQVEYNMFFKGHMERARMDVCNLEKTEVILGIPWLAVHNPEIDWEKEEVEIHTVHLYVERESKKRRESK